MKSSVGWSDLRLKRPQNLLVCRWRKQRRWGVCRVFVFFFSGWVVSWGGSCNQILVNSRVWFEQRWFWGWGSTSWERLPLVYKCVSNCGFKQDLAVAGYIFPPWVVLNWGGSFYAPKPCIWWRNRQTSLISLQILICHIHVIFIFIEVALFRKVGWFYLCYPPSTQGRSTECPPRRRRGARVADSPGGVGGAACDLEMLRWRFFEGNFPRCTNIHVCMCWYIYLYNIYLMHIIFEDGTYILYSMWLYIHSRFNFARWGNHLWGGDVQKTLPLKGAWKNDGFIVSSTYFFVMFFLYRGDMHRKPCSFLALKFDESMT